jgi:hypothetical protein
MEWILVDTAESRCSEVDLSDSDSLIDECRTRFRDIQIANFVRYLRERQPSACMLLQHLNYQQTRILSQLPLRGVYETTNQRLTVL